jgi:hypothetical protein
MQTKALTQDTPTAAPAAVQDRPEATPTKSPTAFYEKMIQRPHVREILARLARSGREETR